MANYYIILEGGSGNGEQRTYFSEPDDHLVYYGGRTGYDGVVFDYYDRTERVKHFPGREAVVYEYAGSEIEFENPEYEEELKRLSAEA